MYANTFQRYSFISFELQMIETCFKNLHIQQYQLYKMFVGFWDSYEEVGTNQCQLYKYFLHTS